jgi:ComEC/Rec2-related protein
MLSNKNDQEEKNICKHKRHYGIIFAKKQKKRNFLYSVKILNCEQYAKNITIISKNDIPQGAIITLPYLTKLRTQNEKQERNPLLNQEKVLFICHKISPSLNQKIISRYNIFHRAIEWIVKKKERIEELTKHFLHNRYATFFETILIGRDLEEKEYRNIFVSWGIVHYLCRSGLHVIIIITILSYLLLFMRIERRISIFIKSIFCLAFLFLTTTSIAFSRSIIMILLALFLQLLNVSTTTLHVVSATLILFALFAPFTFLTLSFQLSFLITTTLALTNYTKKIYKKN